MNTFSFYDAKTGLFLNAARTFSADQVVDNTPPGFVAIEGRFDPLAQRFDIEAGEVVDYVPPKPDDTPSATYSWHDDEKRWVETPTLAAVKAAANIVIDERAGAARLRYITDVPGQGAVYLQKAAEATAFRDASYTGTPGPYVQAEADATGKTTRAAADGILAIAQAWGEVLSPAIERLRIGGKQQVDEATDAAAVIAVRDQTTAILDGI